jgi:hypothetical protein
MEEEPMFPVYRNGVLVSRHHNPFIAEEERLKLEAEFPDDEVLIIPQSRGKRKPKPPPPPPGPGPEEPPVEPPPDQPVPPTEVDTTPPGVPLSFSGRIDGRDVVLDWEAPADTDIRGYIVYKWNGAKWPIYDTLGADDNGIIPTEWREPAAPGALYRVSAFDEVPNHGPWTVSYTVPNVIIKPPDVVAPPSNRLARNKAFDINAPKYPEGTAFSTKAAAYYRELRTLGERAMLWQNPTELSKRGWKAVFERIQPFWHAATGGAYNTARNGLAFVEPLVITYHRTLDEFWLPFFVQYIMTFRLKMVSEWKLPNYLNQLNPGYRRLLDGYEPDRENTDEPWASSISEVLLAGALLGISEIFKANTDFPIAPFVRPAAELDPNLIPNGGNGKDDIMWGGHARYEQRLPARLDKWHIVPPLQAKTETNLGDLAEWIDHYVLAHNLGRFRAKYNLAPSEGRAAIFPFNRIGSHSFLARMYTLYKCAGVDKPNASAYLAEAERMRKAMFDNDFRLIQDSLAIKAEVHPRNFLASSGKARSESETDYMQPETYTGATDQLFVLCHIDDIPGFDEMFLRHVAARHAEYQNPSRTTAHSDVGGGQDRTVAPYGGGASFTMFSHGEESYNGVPEVGTRETKKWLKPTLERLTSYQSHALYGAYSDKLRALSEDLMVNGQLPKDSFKLLAGRFLSEAGLKRPS